MTTQSLQQKIKEIFFQKTLIRSDIRDQKVFIEKLMHYYGNDLLSLFKQTVEEEIIGKDVSYVDKKGRALIGSEKIIAKNQLRASQRQKLQEIVK